MSVTMGALLSSIGDIVTSSVDWMSTIVNFITSSPFVLLFALFGFVGIGISLIRRMIG